MNVHGDGYLRLTIDEVLSMRFAHLVSGLDDDSGHARCGTVTTISGYTEWIGDADPPLTVGWDWVIDAVHEGPRWRRVGSPRTNALLVDARSRDFEWARSLELLGRVVDALAWQDAACASIASRYGTRATGKSTSKGS